VTSRHLRRSVSLDSPQGKWVPGSGSPPADGRFVELGGVAVAVG